MEMNVNSEMVNVAIAEFMGVDLSHQWQETTGVPNCRVCRLDYVEVFSETECPQAYPCYTSLNSPRRLLAEVILKLTEQVNHDDFDDAIFEVINGESNDQVLAGHILTAPPEQIARAIYNVITNAGEAAGGK